MSLRRVVIEDGNVCKIWRVVIELLALLGCNRAYEALSRSL